MQLDPVLLDLLCTRVAGVREWSLCFCPLARGQGGEVGIQL